MSSTSQQGIQDEGGIQIIFNRIANKEIVAAPESMKYEILRVCTFKNYPVNKPFRTSFSKAGFYYAASSDEVVCYVCGIRKAGWNENDNPMEVHRRLQSSCQFLNNNASVNVPIANLTENQLKKFENLDALLSNNSASLATNLSTSNLNTGSNMYSNTYFERAKYKQYITESSRLRTYANWSSDKWQTFTIMVECGFFFAGMEDCVRCFYCGIGLKNWTKDDDPWVEHARWSKNCQYVIDIKGQEFIDLVNRIPSDDEEEEEDPQQITSNTNIPIENLSPEQQILQIMTSDSAQSVRDMGYIDVIIKQALHCLLQSKNPKDINGEIILSKIFDIESSESNEIVSKNETIVESVTSVDLDISQQLANLVLSQNKSEETLNTNNNKTNNKKLLEQKEKIAKMKTENKKLKQETICKICLDKQISRVFLPCGHFVCCEDCCISLKKCPMCRNLIRAVVKSYLP